MPSLKDLRKRIRSVKSAQQITKAMEMVAAAKLRRAQARALAARPYAARITQMLANLSAAAADLEHPLFQARPVKRTALVVVASDRGLCGAYNSNIIRAAEQRVRRAEPGTLVLVTVGRKPRDYFRRRRIPMLASYTELPGDADLEFVRRLTQELSELYLSGQADRVEVLYTQFISALTRRIVTEPFLPVGAGHEGETPRDANAIFEPDAESIFSALLTRYATAKLFAALADALASEQGSKLVAMGAARKNAGEMLDMLVLKRNRMRQAAITKELSEIVGGADALK